MKLRTTFLAASAAALSMTLLTLGTGQDAAASAGSYSVDAVHSSVLFRVKHFGLANFYGRFNDVSGTVAFDEKDPAKTAVDITVKAESVDTANDRRNKHLMSQDFFSAKEFPTLSFKSTAAKKLDATTYEVTGNFTMHGVSKPLTTKFTVTGQVPGQAVGAEATFAVKRSDYGMNFMPDKLGDDVLVIVSVEAHTERK